MSKLIAHIPNILSCSRLCLAGLFPVVPEYFWIWCIVFGGASDFLDGWIARRWNLASWQGGLIDAVADKLFVLSVLITFAMTGRFTGWLVPLIITRDLTVALIALYAACARSWKSFRQMDARWSGKVATAAQFLFMTVVILVPEYTDMALVLTVLFSSLAGLDYAREFIWALRTRSGNKTSQGGKT